MNVRPPRIVCNTRCLNNAFTGMQRYTTEILARLPEVQKAHPPAWMHGTWGHVWEQAVLPVQARSSLIWTPANSGILLAPVRQVITLHDLAMIEGPDSVGLTRRTRYYTWMLPRLLARCAGVLTVSEYSRRQILQRFGLPDDKVLAMPLGVDHARFRPATPAAVAALCERFGLRKGYILSVGSGSSRKNLSCIIKAWSKVQGAVDETVELVITGDADAYNRAFDGTEIPPLPPRTRLTGRVADADLPTLMAGAGVFAFPSLFEGFGLPPLEAMACGTPCVVSNTTSLPEVVGDAAVTIDPTDTDALAAALVRVLTTPVLARKLAAAGIARAAEFTWEKTARQTHDFLLACAS
ncbi:MAG: glycosyltransferase family 4 protein [Pseudomonadaceae bacterium]|nr:glycosyltransferase family 4 protein [Pseudomonadaceae bacterium]